MDDIILRFDPVMGFDVKMPKCSPGKTMLSTSQHNQKLNNFTWQIIKKGLFFHDGPSDMSQWEITCRLKLAGFCSGSMLKSYSS